MEVFLDLGLAFAIGLLIGAERGWQLREAEEGSRVAGIRTFGLIGLLGGLWALLAEQLGEVLIAIAFAAVAAILILAQFFQRSGSTDRGVTTQMAGLVTYALGALAVRDYEVVAAAAAVVTASLLSLKPVLHRWLKLLSPEELLAILKLLLISVVLLPILPDRGFGPWQALNPYEIWWMVVLIAGISFVGYFAMRIAGTQRGLLLTGLLGGLASSTATTLNLARMGRKRTTLHRVLAVGTLLAAVTMFPRMLLEAAVVNIEVVVPLLPPLTMMAVGTLLAAAWIWRGASGHRLEDELPYRNPFEILPALQFGALLAVVMLLARGLRAEFGDAGVYVLAAVSGLADVDAITLSLARMNQQGLATETAVRGIVLAAVVNTLVKIGLVLIIAGWSMGARLLPVGVLVVGLAALGLAVV